MATSLEDIELKTAVSDIPERTIDNDDLLKSDCLSVHEQLILQQIEDRKADRALRERFGDKAYKVARKTLYGWAITLAVYALFQMFHVTIFPPEVIIAITTAVTLNVFAAFLGVIRGLFPSQKSDKD